MARASLRSLEPTRWPGAVANLFLVSSVGLLIYSDVGLSAQIMTNIEPEVISEIGYVACEPVPTRRLDEASGACGAADAADLKAARKALVVLRLLRGLRV